MNTNPKVSIIIPIYNAEQYLKQCLDSVCNQTLKDIEIICINDGSTDSSLQILQQYLNKDHRFKIISKENEGAGKARNKGLSIANGKYISFLDSDDFFELDMLEQMYNCAEEYNTDIVICKSKTFYNGISEDNNNIKDNLLPNKKIFSSSDISKYIFQFHIGWCWDKLYKASFIKSINISFQNLKRHNDAFFSHISTIKATRIYVLDKALVHYRTDREKSITNQVKDSEFYINSICKSFLCEIKRDLIKNNLFEKFEQSYINYCISHFIQHFRNLSVKTQLKLLDDFGIKKGKYKKDFFYYESYFKLYFITSHKILTLLYNPYVKLKKFFIYGNQS